MEGIHTLERKDRQRESKTALLLSLKEEVVALRRELADERDLMAKMTSWVQQTLKPSLVQLRTEQTQSVDNVRAELKGAVDKLSGVDRTLEQSITHNAETAISKITSLGERHEALTLQLQQTRAAVSGRFDAVAADTNKALQSVAEKASVQVTSMYERASKERQEQCGDILRQMTKALKDSEASMVQQWGVALTEQKRWVDAEKEKWTHEQAQRMQHFTQSVHDDRTVWQKQFLDKNAEFSSSVNVALSSMKGDMDARWSARVAEHAQWEQKKELWMSSFLKDNQLAHERLLQSWTHQFADWKAEWAKVDQLAQKRHADDFATLTAKLSQEYRELQLRLLQERKQWEQVREQQYAEGFARVDARVAENIQQIVEWQRTQTAADKEWKQVVWETLIQWQQRYGPVIRQFVANEKSKLEEESKDMTPQVRASFPVPEWLQQLLSECGMQKYGPLLCSHGFDTPAVVMALGSNDLDGLGTAPPSGPPKALLLHLQSKQMAAEEQEARERQQRDYEEAKAKLQADLEREFQVKMDAVNKLAEASAAETQRMEQLRLDMERKDRDMLAVTSQLEQIAVLLRQQGEAQQRKPEALPGSTEDTVVELSLAPAAAAPAYSVEGPAKDLTQTPTANAISDFGSNDNNAASAPITPISPPKQEPSSPAASALDISPVADTTTPSKSDGPKKPKKSVSFSPVLETASSKAPTEGDASKSAMQSKAKVRAALKGSKKVASDSRPVPPPPTTATSAVAAAVTPAPSSDTSAIMPSSSPAREAGVSPLSSTQSDGKAHTESVPPKTAAGTAVSVAQVRDWITSLGEKEPKGPRFRILYRTLMQCVTLDELGSLATAVTFLQSTGALMISAKGAPGGATTFGGNEILTFNPTIGQ